MKRKISERERWVVAIAPTVIVGGIYLLGFAGDLSANLEKQQGRLRAAMAPTPAPVGASPTLAKAKATLAEVKKGISDHEARIADLEPRVAAMAKAVAGGDQEPVRVIERVEEVFARYGITPMVSESGASAGGPTALAAALAPSWDTGKPGEHANEHVGARVWHYRFNSVTPRYQHAFADLLREVPEVVPLTLNFVYNPADDGETRLLELWVLY